MRIERNMPVVRLDPPGGKVEAIDIGDPAGTVDDAIGFKRALRSALLIDDAEPVPRTFDPLELDPGVDRDSNAFCLGAQLRDSIRIHVGEQPRQHLEDRDPSAPRA
jgi:hypothetical protein